MIEDISWMTKPELQMSIENNENLLKEKQIEYAMFGRTQEDILKDFDIQLKINIMKKRLKEI